MSQFTNANPQRPAAEGPVFQSPPVVIIVIAALAAIHGALVLGGANWQVWSRDAFAFIPARLGSVPFPMIPGSQVWSFLTYALLHGGWGHLAANSLWLLIFGTPVARFLGASRFLGLAAIAAIGGAAAALVMHWGEQYIMVGASGSVSGLMGAAVPIMYGGTRGWRSSMAGSPGTTHPLSPGQLVRSRNAVLFTLVWLVITMLSGAYGWTGNSFVEEGGIAWEAHVGGFIGGICGFYLLWRDWMRKA